MDTKTYHNTLHAIGKAFPCLVSAAESAHAARVVPVKGIHVELAVERVLADVDGVVDWLGSECSQRSHVSSDFATRVPGRLLTADTAVVLHAALIAADRGDEMGCLDAMRVLTQRYLAGADKRVRALASEFAHEH